jgi:hypothetical protein
MIKLNTIRENVVSDKELILRLWTSHLNTNFSGQIEAVNLYIFLNAIFLGDLSQVRDEGYNVEQILKEKDIRMVKQ